MSLRPFLNRTSEESRLWNPVLQQLPRDRLDELHLKRIQSLIAFAYENSPLHRRLYDAAGLHPSDVRTLDDFYTKVPFTDKPDLVGDQEAGHFPGLAVPEEYQSIYFQTTGTTGTFLKETFSEWDMVRMAQHYCYMMWDYGVRAHDSVLMCFNFGTWAGLWSFYWACRLMGIKIYSTSGMSSQERVGILAAWRPTMVAATPTYLLHLAEVARKECVDLRVSGVRFVLGGGEPGLSIPVTRSAVQDAWGATAMDGYGISEAGTVFSACAAAPTGVHIIEDSYHAYSVDSDGNPVPDGEVGENIVTSYSHLAQPIIKYRTHDLVRIHRSPDHGCGWTWGYLDGTVLGRTDYMIQIRGTNVYPTAVEALLGEVKGTSNHYELHITRAEGVDRMEVKVEASEATIDRTSTEGRLVDLARQRLGVKLEFTVVEPESLPRYELKTKRFFDHRPKEVRRELDR
ncbi:MAG: AMP-binding protein [Actinomycetota bacterium]